MGIRFPCPNCQKTLVAPDGTSGAQLACPACKQPLKVPEPVLEVVPADEPFTGKPGITKENFERVRVGMTLPQVEAILGKGKQAASGVLPDGTPHTMYEWKVNRLFAVRFIQVMFQHGRVVDTLQVGL